MRDAFESIGNAVNQHNALESFNEMSDQDFLFEYKKALRATGSKEAAISSLSKKWLIDVSTVEGRVPADPKDDDATKKALLEDEGAKTEKGRGPEGKEIEDVAKTKTARSHEQADGEGLEPIKKTENESKAQHRGDAVFQSTDKKVNDDKDHFPINSASQARNALARAGQYSSSPKWYDGSLEELKASIERAVKKKYPSIDVGGEDKNESIDETQALGVSGDKVPAQQAGDKLPEAPSNKAVKSGEKTPDGEEIKKTDNAGDKLPDGPTTKSQKTGQTGETGQDVDGSKPNPAGVETGAPLPEAPGTKSQKIAQTKEANERTKAEVKAEIKDLKSELKMFKDEKSRADELRSRIMDKEAELANLDVEEGKIPDPTASTEDKIKAMYEITKEELENFKTAEELEVQEGLFFTKIADNAGAIEDSIKYFVGESDIALLEEGKEADVIGDDGIWIKIKPVMEDDDEEEEAEEAEEVEAPEEAPAEEEGEVDIAIVDEPIDEPEGDLVAQMDTDVVADVPVVEPAGSAAVSPGVIAGAERLFNLVQELERELSANADPEIIVATKNVVRTQLADLQLALGESILKEEKTMDLSEGMTPAEIKDHFMSLDESMIQETYAALETLEDALPESLYKELYLNVLKVLAKESVAEKGEQTIGEAIKEGKLSVDYFKQIKESLKKAKSFMKDKKYAEAAEQMDDCADDANDAAKAIRKIERNNGRDEEAKEAKAAAEAAKAEEIVEETPAEEEKVEDVA